MRTLRLILILAISICHAAAAGESGKELVYIDIVGKGEFDVLYHRAISNATGATFGGLVGASMQAGIESSKDTKKREELQALVAGDSWKDQFLENLNTKLASKGLEAVWIEDYKAVDNGTILQIHPKAYGFKMVDTSTQLMSAFVDFQASVFDAKRTKPKKKERMNFFVMSRGRLSYNALASDASTLNGELDSALSRSAKKLANKVIYR